MDSFSSLTLLVALGAGAVGTFAGWVAIVERRTRQRKWWGAATTALAGAVVAAMFGTASLLVHVRAGHGPASVNTRPVAGFVAVHPVYLGVAALAVLAFSGWAIATFRTRNRRP